MLRVSLQAISSANPPICLSQEQVIDLSSQLFRKRPSFFEKILPSYKNAGIKKRYSCVPAEWYLERHDWKERNTLYIQNALQLLERLTYDLLEKADLNSEAIDAVVLASSTGIATPSLEAQLADRIPLRRDIYRMPLFGLGCAGGVSGLARAAMMAQALPGKNILLLCVELNALTFRAQDFSKENMIATVLFGDGAAGAILNTEGEGPYIEHTGEYQWPQSLDIMGWEVENDGFKIVLSKDIPTLVKTDFKNPLSSFMDKSSLKFGDQLGYACHPGGLKVVQALESIFYKASKQLSIERSILQDYGNMSGPTALFVLERALQRGLGEKTLMTAFGPGFTASFVTLGMRSC